MLILDGRPYISEVISPLNQDRRLEINTTVARNQYDYFGYYAAGHEYTYYELGKTENCYNSKGYTHVRDWGWEKPDPVSVNHRYEMFLEEMDLLWNRTEDSLIDLATNRKLHSKCQVQTGVCITQG